MSARGSLDFINRQHFRDFLTVNKPELLAPAGSFEHLKMAAAYGADAVYAGIPRWSLRVRGNGFTREDFAKGIDHLHERGKKFFCRIKCNSAHEKNAVIYSCA